MFNAIRFGQTASPFHNALQLRVRFGETNNGKDAGRKEKKFNQQVAKTFGSPDNFEVSLASLSYSDPNAKNKFKKNSTPAA